MEEVKTFNFDSGTNGLLASVLPALANKGVDTNALLAMMGNKGNGFFGGNGFEGIIMLIVVAAIFGGGFGNGNGIFGGGGNNNAEREMLMSAIQRNGIDIGQLASVLNCSIGKVDAAIGQVATQICNLANQQGTGFMQVINSLQAGNATLASQLANCCCEIKGAIKDCCCDLQRDIASTNANLTRGFADVGYALRDQTCNLEKAIADNTAQVLAGQRAAEMREMQDKLDALREKNSQQAIFINNAQQTAQFASMLAPIQADLAELKCNQIPVKKIACPETYVPINRSINENYGLVPNCGFGAFGGFGGWNGWGGNCNTFNWG